MSDTFALTPEFTLPWDMQHSTLATSFESGDVQTRPRWKRTRRRWTLRWNAATDSERGEIEQFFQRHRGSADSFTWTPPAPVGPPGRAHTLATAVSGALGQRTYYVVHTWVTAGGETTQSIQKNIVVPANSVLVVTVPEFPTNVTAAKVYASTLSGDEELQATINTSAGSWTEPDTGLITGANPPTSNGAPEALTVHFVDDTLRVNWFAPRSYQIEFAVEELFA